MSLDFVAFHKLLLRNWSTMEELSVELETSEKPKCFTPIKSSYSLRPNPARSNSKPKPRPKSTTKSDKISSLELLISSNVAKSEGDDTPTLLRRYPTRARISAVQNSSSKSPKESRLEDSLESGSQKRTQEILHGFRETYYKVIKKSETGDASRPDLVAYNIYRGNNKNMEHVNRCLGNVPGIKVGDTFEFRVELFLLGLHCKLQGSIDYVQKGERLVASSVIDIFSGKSSNNVRISDDVIVFRGGGNERKDQQMIGGNLALMNSIDEKNPVRVLLCVRDRKDIVYVYVGLYLVEKYWRKKGNHGRNVFLFQLRKLEGQPNFDIKRFTKMVSSSAHIKDTEVRDFLPSNCKIGGKGANSLGKRRREEEEELRSIEIQNVDSRKRIKQTLYEFLSLYEKLAEEDKAKQKKKRKKEPGERSRFDIEAYNLLKDKHKDLTNVSRILGIVPGIEVGDKFHYRVELSLLGLHCQLQSDVDYILKDKKLLATSIVSFRFGKYNGNACKFDILTFCGSGAKNQNQRMVNGNLSLKNSIDAKTPVRVFYGFRKNRGTAFYIYCGLYLVEKSWRKKDENGFFVFMFRLRILPGQPKLDIKEAKKSLLRRNSKAPKYSEDISRGKEKLPIRVVNTIDEEKLCPFEYITDVIYPLNFNPTPLEGCNCIEGCSDSNKCACAVRNGGELPFNTKGAIVEAKPLVYECGPNCKCPPTCHNRVSEHGIKFPLEVFKTETMGWGVRSRAFIPSGSFICEYVGELLQDEEAQKRTTDEYLFAIGNNYYDESIWEGLSSVPCLQKGASSENVEDGGFTLDTSRYGNIGRLINHSCTPNLYAQNLLNDHDDKRMPRVVFFACEDIPPMQELFYHYNYTIDDVHDSDGNIRKKSCYCGSIECTGRLY